MSVFSFHSYKLSGSTNSFALLNIQIRKISYAKLSSIPFLSINIEELNLMMEKISLVLKIVEIIETTEKKQVRSQNSQIRVRINQDSYVTLFNLLSSSDLNFEDFNIAVTSPN